MEMKGKGDTWIEVMKDLYDAKEYGHLGLKSQNLDRESRLKRGHWTLV